MADRLRELGATVELVEITTSGDRDQQGSVQELDQQGVFTKEIQVAVLKGEADLAVHSLKDLPTETVAGLVLAAVPLRENCFDVLVSNNAKSLVELPKGAKVGTGSLRRQAQLLHLRSDLQIIGIRGNVDTRLRKLADGEYDAIVLAAAGLKRLELAEHIVEELSPPRMLPAPGQGALGLECHHDAHEIRKFVSQLEHAETRAAVDAERAMLAMLHAGCSAPVGAWARMEHDSLKFDGLVASLDGQQVLRANATGSLSSAIQLGEQVAEALHDQGALEIIAGARLG